MEKGTAYFELQSFVIGSTLNVSNAQLIEAMRDTAIKGFGWSVGLVIDNEAYRPKSKDKAIEALIQTDESFDNWSLTSKGELNILKTLFEDRRDKTAIFLDVRLVRLFEAFARVAALYRRLGVTEDQQITVQFKLGGLLSRTLKVANQNRLMSPIPRVSNTDTFSRTDSHRLSDLLNVTHLESIVINYIHDLAQLFDAFELQPEIARGMIEEHRVFKGVLEKLNR